MIALNTVVYNEVHRIPGLLAHAAAFCDELIVVDQGSTDGTIELAHELGAVVVLDEHYGYCEPSRPLAAARTRSDWICCLDADEVISPRYIDRLLLLQHNHTFDVYKLGIASYVDGKRSSPKTPKHPRLFRKGSVTYGASLHTRILPVDGAKVFESPDGEAWVLNTKSQWEQDLDHARYEALSVPV